MIEPFSSIGKSSQLTVSVCPKRGIRKRQRESVELHLTLINHYNNLSTRLLTDNRKRTFGPRCASSPTYKILKRDQNYIAYPNLSDKKRQRGTEEEALTVKSVRESSFPRSTTERKLRKFLFSHTDHRDKNTREHTGSFGTHVQHGDEFPGGASPSFTARGATFPRRCRRRRVVSRGRRSRRLFARARRGSSPMTED